ncbi:MAG: nucleotidyltransferase family protein [Candidatus Margulisbacteria bacterium]|nr:nucleotidyltransferase family protein [Candidatus Margulisiibacteriota bacterium]
MRLNEIKKRLLKFKPELEKSYNVEEIGIFGSYVRNEQKEDSDLDILVEFREVPGLFKFMHLEDYLSSILGIKVDLVRKKALKPRIGRYILNEVVYI